MDSEVKVKSVPPPPFQPDSFFISSLEEAPLVSKASVSTYIFNLKKAVKVCNASSIHDLLSHPGKYIPVINAKVEAINSRISVWVAIITVLRTSDLKAAAKALYNIWYTAMMVDRKERNKQENLNQPTARQSETTYSWPNILRKRNEYPKDSFEHLLLGMYTYIPPRRQVDYAHLRVYTKPTEIPLLDHNHIHLCHPMHKAYMYLKDFKTVHVMKPFFNKFLPEELVEIIKNSIINKPRSYLFTQVNGQPFATVNSYTKYSNGVLKKIFDNQKMSVNALRHSLATYINSKQNVTLAERKRIAYLMGHSVNKALAYVFFQKDDATNNADNTLKFR